MDHLGILASELGDASDFDVDGINSLSENDVSDEEIDAEELARRMWKDKIKLKRIKERQQKLALQQSESVKSKTKKISDQALRKKMARAPHRPTARRPGSRLSFIVPSATESAQN